MSAAAATRWHSLRATVGGRKQRRTLPRNSLKSPQLRQDGWIRGRRLRRCTRGIKGATICKWYIEGGFTIMHYPALKAWMKAVFNAGLWCEDMQWRILNGFAHLRPGVLLVYLVCVRLVIWWWRAVITPPTIYHACTTNIPFSQFPKQTLGAQFLLLWVVGKTDW